MCGIVGQASFKNEVEKKWLISSLEILKNRGPDANGIWISEDNLIGFGHTRLSIIDLSERSNQPMHSKCGLIKIVFNGEIYNYPSLRNKLLDLGHTFHTDSDTEVIIEAYKEWREEFPQYLVGMFSIAIYDIKNNYVFLVRDRAGEKPLYYFYQNGNLIFSSQIKSITENSLVCKRLSNRSFLNYLKYGHSPSDQSLIENVKKIRPGHILKFDINDQSIKSRRYWIPPKKNRYVYDLETHVEKIHMLLKDSVKSQLISDVPIGVLLSGGLDSSLVTGLASQLVSNLNTFTITIPNFQRYDEKIYADQISKFFNTNHTSIPIQEIGIDSISEIIEFMDEPIGDSSLIPTFLLSKVVSNYCKVVLGGDGSDELFGGYTYYSRQMQYKNLFSIFPQFPRSFLSRGFQKVLPCGLRGRNFAHLLGDKYDDYPRPTTFFFDELSISKINKKILEFNESPYISNEDKLLYENMSFLKKSMIQDFLTYLPENILFKTDRASMANSLELRAPFLDFRLMEYVFNNLSDEFCCDFKNRKIILRELGKKILPRNFDYNRKQGFSIPLSYFFSNKKFISDIKNVLLDNNSIFNSKFTSKLINTIDSRYYSNSERIYSLYLFELWRVKNKISVQLSYD